jgi:hypothetical protein
LYALLVFSEHADVTGGLTWLEPTAEEAEKTGTLALHIPNLLN